MAIDRGPLVQFPVVAKVPYSSTRVLKVFFFAFFPDSSPRADYIVLLLLLE